MIRTKTLIILALLVMAPFSIARAFLLVLYQPLFSELSPTLKALAFIEGLRFDASSAAYLLLVPTLVLCLPMPWPRGKMAFWWRGTWLWVVFVLVALLGATLAIDLIYFDFVKRHITNEPMHLGQDLQVMLEMATGVYLTHLLLFVAALGLLSLVWLKWVIPSLALTRAFDPRRATLRFTLAFLLIFTLARGGFSPKPLTLIDAYARGSSPYASLCLNGFFSISHNLLSASDIKHDAMPLDEALKALAPAHGFKDATYPFVRKLAPLTSNPSKPNLIFILVESLSFKYVDALAHKGYGVTPRIDALIKDSVSFQNFYAAGQRSVEGVQASLTGVPPLIGLPSLQVGLSANYNALGNLAKQQGYQTLYVQSNRRRSFRGDAIAGATGFNHYYGMEDIPLKLDYPDPKGAKFGWDYETLLFAASKIKQLKQPVLAFVVLGTTHTPYPSLPDQFNIHPPSKEGESGFLNCLAYTDHAIGAMLDQAKAEGWYDNSIFIITADHALAHYQTGGYAGRFHIPLILHGPSFLKPKNITKSGSQLELLPTLAALMGYQGSLASLGGSLLANNSIGFAPVRSGNSIGLIGAKGYVRHSLKNRLEAKGFDHGLSEAEISAMEIKLLALDSAVYQLLKQNHWARLTNQ